MAVNTFRDVRIPPSVHLAHALAPSNGVRENASAVAGLKTKSNTDT